MTKQEFMSELDFLLEDISEEERKEALEFYDNYFIEAGSENEQKVIEELGTPAKVAAIIKDGLKGQFDEHITSGNEGFTNKNYQKNYEVIKDKKVKRNHWTQLDKRDRILLIGLLILSLFPITLGSFGILIPLFIVLAVIIFCPFICAIVLGVIGVVMIVAGVIQCFSFLATGLIYIGIGTIIISIAQLFEKASAWLLKDLLPRIINPIVDAIAKIFNKGEKAYENNR